MRIPNAQSVLRGSLIILLLSSSNLSGCSKGEKLDQVPEELIGTWKRTDRIENRLEVEVIISRGSGDGEKTATWEHRGYLGTVPLGEGGIGRQYTYWKATVTGTWRKTLDDGRCQYTIKTKGGDYYTCTMSKSSKQYNHVGAEMEWRIDGKDRVETYVKTW